MPLSGRGVAAIWHNVAKDFQDDYNRWHVHEHMPERVAIAGFRRGRRYVAIDGDPQFFHFYETESLETLTSPAYLERLNNPTTWTRRIGPHLRDNNRSLCSVVISQGRGCGTAILAGRLTAESGLEDDMVNRLREGLFSQLRDRAGIVGAHLLKGDQQSSATETEEKAIRGALDAVADWVILIDAIEAAVLDRVSTELDVTPSGLAKCGVVQAALGTYRLHYLLDEADLA